MIAHRGNLSLDKRRSHCPQCQKVLKPLDLVPVLSWCFLKGCCRYCRASIPWLYPLIEIGVLLATLIHVFLWGILPIVQTLSAIAAYSILAGLAVYDIRHKRIPNILILMLFVLGLLYHLWPFVTYADTIDIPEYIGGAVVFALVVYGAGWLMHKITGRQALGMGDVKFFAVSGLWLGLSNLAIFCMISGVLGVLFGLLWQKIKKEAVFPFGPALIAAFFIVFCLQSSQIL